MTGCHQGLLQSAITKMDVTCCNGFSSSSVVCALYLRYAGIQSSGIIFLP